jgi:hypothetical protein
VGPPTSKAKAEPPVDTAPVRRTPAPSIDNYDPNVHDTDVTDEPHHHKAVVDESVGFMGPGVPAGPLPQQ